MSEGQTPAPSGGEAPPAPAGGEAPPAPAPDGGNWRDGFDADIRDHPALANAKDLNGLGRELIGAQEVIGRKGLIPPAADSSPDDFGAFYGSEDYKTAMGIAADGSGYKVEVPEGIELSDFDKDLHAAMIEAAPGAGISPDMFSRMAPVMQGVINKYLEASKKHGVEAAGQLKREWGPDYDKNFALSNQAGAAVFGDAFPEIAALRLQDHTLLVDNVNFVKGFNKLGGMMSEDTLAAAGGRGAFASPQAAHQEYKRLRALPAYRNKSDKEHTPINDQVNALLSQHSAAWQDLNLA